MVTAIVISILVIIILICLGYILYLKLFKKHTRERFAFVGLSAILALCTTFILQIYSNQGIVNAVIVTSNIVLKADLRTYQADFRDHLIVAAIISTIIYTIYKIHQNWDGPVSTISVDKKRFKEESSIYEEAFVQLTDFFKTNKKIKPYSDHEKTQKYSVFSSSEYEKSPWYEDVYELFTFRSKQYFININNDYYDEENCFIAKYGQNKDNIAILCSLNQPTKDELDRFIKFIYSQNKLYAKIIVATKNINNSKYTQKHSNILIEFRYENELLNSLVDFKYYTDFIKEQFNSRGITEGNKITLRDFYVDLHGKTESGDPIPSMEEYALSWLEIKDNNKHLAVLGEYGCGKSVFSLKLTHDLLEKKTETTRIPLLIELRGRSPRNLSALEILSTWASSFRIEPFALWKLHKEGKLLIIFEGFDEMDMVGDKEVRFSHFQRLWEFATPKSKIIITGRPNFFLDDKELKTNLGIDKPFESSHYCEAIYLEKLNKKQIRTALRHIDIETKNQVLDLIDNKSINSNFYDLVSRPALLYLVSLIWKERKLSQKKAAINSAVVIDEFIQFSYSRQSDKNVYFPLTTREREYFMLGVAVAMHNINGFSNQISKSDLEGIILKLYRDFPNDITPTNNATQQRNLLLKERLKDNNAAEDMVLTDVRSCGILVYDMSRKDYFKFAHKSFFEYLVSLYFVESIIRDKEYYHLMVTSITNTLDISLIGFTHSKETVTFTAEILTSKLKLRTNNINKKELAQKLFEVLYPIKFFCKHPKLASFIDVYVNSRLFAFSSLIFFSIIYPLNYLLLHEKSSFISGSIYITFTFQMIIMLIAFFIRTISKYSGVKRCSIWLQCCNELQIEEDIITSIITEKYLKLIKGEYKHNLLGWISANRWENIEKSTKEDLILVEKDTKDPSVHTLNKNQI